MYQVDLLYPVLHARYAAGELKTIYILTRGAYFNNTREPWTASITQFNWIKFSKEEPPPSRRCHR